MFSYFLLFYCCPFTRITLRGAYWYLHGGGSTEITGKPSKYITSAGAVDQEFVHIVLELLTSAKDSEGVWGLFEEILGKIMKT